MTHLNRRNFMAAGSLGALSFAVPAIVGARPAAETVRIGVIGLGGRSRILISYLIKMKNVRITAICDVDSEHLAAAQKNLPQAKGYRDLRDLLDDPNVDAVVIATCNHWHVLASIWAMQAGKDVYVEKPLCLSFWEGKQLVNARKKYNKMCQIGTQMRTDPVFHPEVQKFLHEEKQLGAIQSVRINRFSPRPSIGIRNTPLVPPASVDYNLWLGPASDLPLYRKQLHYDWHWMWNTGNGETGNWGAHLLDDCRNDILRDAIRMPKRILSGGARIGYNDAGETPNSMFVLYDTGIVPIVFCISNLPDAKNRRSAGTCPGPQHGYIAYCEGGRYEKHWGGSVAFDSDGKVIREFTGTSEREGTGTHLNNFINAVLTRDYSSLSAPIETGYDSSFWYNGANVAWRLGEPYSKKEALAVDPSNGLMSSVIGDLERHLGAQGLAVNADTFKMSRFLELDPDKNQVKGDYAQAAADLMNIHYRKPFVVPEI